MRRHLDLTDAERGKLSLRCHDIGHDEVDPLRRTGRIDGGDTTYTSSTDLATALRRAESAHGEHEKRTGQRDANWSDWYAEYMVNEQSGKPLPT